MWKMEGSTEHSTLPPRQCLCHGSERTLSDDEARDEEAQQRTIQAVMDRLQNQLGNLQQITAQGKGKRKADEVEALIFEESAKDILSQTKKDHKTLENEVQKQVDALQARKKSHTDQREAAAQSDEELWGHTSSAEDQGIPQSS